MSRRRRIAFLTVVVIALCGFAFAFRPSESRVTRENFDRIRKGMSRAEVEAILGTPGDYRTGPMQYDPMTMLMDGSEYWRSELMAISEWQGDEGTILVAFERSTGSPGGALLAEWGEVTEPQANPIRRILWRVERLWKKQVP